MTTEEKVEIEEIEKEVEEMIVEGIRDLKEYEDDGSGFFYFTDDTDWSQNALMPKACITQK